MKKLALGVAAALALGLGSVSAPAVAASAQPNVTAPITDLSAQRRVVKKVVRHGPRCSVRKVVTRGPHGHRVVRTSRVCR